MGKKKYIVGGALAAAAGYLYMKYRDELAFEYEAEFETEVEVVETDAVDEEEHQTPEPHEVDDDADIEGTETEDNSTDEQVSTMDYDRLVDAALKAIDEYAVDGTNVYAVEPYDDRGEGTPLSKYSELEAEPDIVISSFAGRNLMFIVADDDRLDNSDELRETIEAVAKKAGFSVLLVIPEAEDARDRAAQIEEDLNDISLYVKNPENIHEAL